MEKVYVLHAMHTQTHPTFITRLVRDMQNRATEFWASTGVRRRLKFNVVWLVRAFQLSDLLRTSASLGEALQQSLHSVLPPVLVPIFRRTLEETKQLRPDPSTISRWRVLLDGAFMLWMRSYQESFGKCRRFIMSDSSSQHSKHFQLTSIQTVREDDLFMVYEDANDLMQLWRSSPDVAD